MRAATHGVSVLLNPLVYARLHWAGGPRLLGGTLLALWVLIVLLPAALLFFGLHRGIRSDPDITNPRERRTYLPWAALSAGVSAAVALLVPFVRPVRLSVVGIFAWLGASTLVSLVWKASLHVGGTTGIVALVWVLFGPVAGLAHV